MENNNNIVSNTQPPFETSSGGSLDKETLTSYQKKIYNDALLYATKNNDPQAKEFALKTALSTNISHGKNNPFGDLASKNEPGTIKDGIKYRDYPTVNVPLSKQYERYIQEQNNNAIIEQNQQQAIDNLAQAQADVAPQIQNVQENQLSQQNIPQDIAPNEQNSTQLNFNLEPGAVYNRNFADQQVQNSNPSEQINVTNPIQQPFAIGGMIDPPIKKSYNPALAKNKGFQNWYKKNTLEGQQNIPYSNNQSYDYLSFYMNNEHKNKDFNIEQHFPDTYKRPTHPTFSDESIYSTPENPGGHWDGEIYIPQGVKQFNYGGLMGKSYEGGGNLNSYDVGGTHEQNKSYSGIPQGKDNEGKQNVVEQGETSHIINGKKFIFSHRIMIDGTRRDNPLNNK